jgi:methionine sulfoxide reductase heme-binding subunit
VAFHPARAKPAVFAIALLPLAWLVWRGVTGDLGANPFSELEIRTGHWTLRFLAATLALTPLRRVAGWNWVAGYRRMLGLFTFFYACVHLTLWLVDWQLDAEAMVEEIVKHRYILVGMTTWLILLPLAVTSTKGWVRRLGGKRWVALHRLVYAAAITATVHYLWAVKKDTLYPLIYLALFVLLLGARVAFRRRRAAAASA